MGRTKANAGAVGKYVYVLFPKIPTDMICECRHCSQCLNNKQFAFQELLSATFL